MTLRPEIQEAAERLQNEIDQHPFSTVGCALTAHAGEIRRIDYSLTVKTMPADKRGGHNATHQR